MEFVNCAKGAICCLILFGLSACSSPEVQKPIISAAKATADPAIFDVAIAESESDFVKNILKDYKITNDELWEAFTRLSECLTDHGIAQRIERDVHGAPFLLVELDADKGMEKETKACEAQWLGQIEYLAKGEGINPAAAEDQILIADCLVRMGIVPKGFSAQDLAEVVAKSASKVNIFFDEDDNIVGYETSNPITTEKSLLPGGIPLFENELTDPCLIDPRGAGLK